MLHKWIFSLVAIFFFSHVFGDSCNLKISGYILDRHDNSALDYATIYIMELQAGASADSNGYYEFKNICPGSYSFIIEHIGCAPDTVKTLINASTAKNFYLEHHTQELAEVVTMAKRIDKEGAQTAVLIDSKALAALEGKDFGNILATIAGVNQLKTGTTISKPVIHGLYGDRISIISNGVKLESQDWGTEHAPEIDPFAANNIKVIKGVGSLEYGTDAMGGMVLMEPPVLQKKEHMKGAVSVIGQTNGHGITASVNFEQGFKKQFSYFLQGTYKRLGDQQAPHYNLTNTGLQEGNLSTGFGFLKKGWEVNTYYALFSQQLAILKSSHIGNLTDLENAIARDTPLIVNPFTYKIENPKQKITHHLAKINIIKFFHNQDHIDLTYALQLNGRKEYDVRRGGRSGIPALDMHLWSNNLSGSYQWLKRFKKEVSIDGKTGFSLLTKHNANNPGTGIRPLIPDYYQYEFGLYDMEKLSVKNFIIEAGARYDYTRFLGYKFDRNNVLLKPKYNFHTYAFSFGGNWKNDSSTLQIQTNFSVSSRFPNASELFSDGLHHGIAALEFGNPDLHPERGFKWVNTISTGFKKFLQAEITFYVSRINGFIYLAPLPDPVLTIRGAFPAFRYYQTNARLLGMDATLNSDPLSFLTLSFRSSIVRGKNLSAGDNLIYMPSDRINASVKFHRDFKKIRNLHAGIGIEHVFRQKKTPALITDYKAAPPAYTTLNAETGFEYRFSPKHTLAFSVSGENIANTSYRDYLNRFRYYSDELGWNLIFRLKYSFSN
jgi:iron complex outermembrane receptor protein